MYDNNPIYIQNVYFYCLKQIKLLMSKFSFKLDVISLVGNLADLNVLSDNETNEIINWESENIERISLLNQSKTH